MEYLEGLEKLHEQVSAPKDIDQNYVGALASDLAYLVLSDKKKWYVDKDEVPEDHAFHGHIHNNTWPTPKQIEVFGD